MVRSAASASSANLLCTGANHGGSQQQQSPHSPLGILLVSKDESAERVLFMYPFHPELPFQGKSTCDNDVDNGTGGAIGAERDRLVDESSAATMDQQQQPGTAETAAAADPESETSRTFGLPVKMLAPLLQTKSANNEHGAPFEIKVDNIRFAGFPWRIESCGGLCLAVVFILPGSADAHIVDAFQRLSKKIAIAINTEQQRCNYLREQICLMQPAHDEYEALSDEQRRGGQHQSPYETILAKSGLAMHLRDIFEDVCEYGMVDVFVDDCIEVGFCVEPKALCHAGLTPRSSAQVEAIMARIQPYHGILFLEDSVPSPDSNPFVLRFLEEYEPSRSIEELALLSGLSAQSQVLQIVRHYLLWARAMVIYPICTSNVYANSTQLPAAGYKALEAAFAKQFPDFQLAEVLETFSPPCTLGSFLQDTAIYMGHPSLHMSMLVFLLKNQLLVQVHTYFFLLPPASNFTRSNAEHAQQQHVTQQQQNGTTTQQVGGGQLAGAATDNVMLELGMAGLEVQDNTNNNQQQMANGHGDMQQGQGEEQPLSARIRTCVNSCRELLLSPALKSHVLDICGQAIHQIGVSEEQMFWLANTFISFVPFLNGRHHVEDIIYRTRLDRSTVMRVLDTFSDIVCPFRGQDLIVECDGDDE